MKYFSIIFILCYSICFAQDYDIDISYDKFTGDSIFFMYDNELEGGSFISLTHCGFNVTLIKHKDKSQSYIIDISLTTAKNFTIKDGTLGSSLYIKIDTVIYDFKASGMSYKPSQSYYFNNATYGSSRDFLLMIVNSKTVLVRIKGFDNSYYDFSFERDNFINLKDFLNKY
jgi:hypothetical protein